jgi:hypothetical protein
MRIRSIRPEFWSSEDIAALDWEVRLIFIGLWSYVDDNGAGRDNTKLIKADLFPLEDDPHWALMQVSGALNALAAGGQICRYKVDGKPLLHICAWDKNQIISRPSKARYERLACDDAALAEVAHVNDMSPHANVSLGEGEKGRRGEGEKKTSASAGAEQESDPAFDAFWAAYPKKRDKGHAVKAYRTAAKKASAAEILTGLGRQLPEWSKADPKFIPLAATWLNGERWADETGPVATAVVDGLGRTVLPPLPPKSPWGSS